MAETSYSKKCTSCGGNKWEYKRELKLWICRYCGNQVERQEQYDGLYTIKNVVRQVILDSAYRRLEQADRNISECQKINSRYVGTLIAGICFRLIAAVNGGLAGQDSRALLGQLRRDYEQLKEESPELNDDETAVYEFLDSSDAWAALATVFDTLGDQTRRDYLLTLVDPSQVFSKETNKSLLRYALKNARLELAEQILANEQNVDIKDACDVVLSTCPDGEHKGRMAAKLIAGGAIPREEKSLIEDYLTCGDCIATKMAVAIAACQVEMPLNLDILLREVLANAEESDFRNLMQALFTRHLFDGEIESLLDFAAAQKQAQKSLAVLDAMESSGQFVPLNVRQAQVFVENSQWTAEARTEAMKLLRGFTTDDRLWETVAGYYLCCGKDTAETRGDMLKALLEHVSSVPSRDFEQYVMTCCQDGAEKGNRISRILQMPDMNAGFFHNLAGKYLQSGGDDPEIKATVFRQLLDCGITIDGSVLVDYICTGADTADNKVELVQLAVKNGSTLRTDALSIYLERCADQFSPQLFAALYKDGSSVTAKALENYILRCKDAPAVKVSNAVTLAGRTGLSLGSSACTIQHQGCSIGCSLAQAYILTTTDEIGPANSMVSAMVSGGTKLNTEIKADGRAMKFSKYLNEKKQTLSSVAAQICQEHKLFGFSLFA